MSVGQQSLAAFHFATSMACAEVNQATPRTADLHGGRAWSEGGAIGQCGRNEVAEACCGLTGAMHVRRVGVAAVERRTFSMPLIMLAACEPFIQI